MMHELIDDDSWRLIDGQWVHRPWWKVAINTVLRAVQPQRRKLVIYSVTVWCRRGKPRCVGYGIGLVEHR